MMFLTSFSLLIPTFSLVSAAIVLSVYLVLSDTTLPYRSTLK